MRSLDSLTAERDYLRQCAAGLGLRSVPSSRSDVYAAIRPGEALTGNELWRRVDVAPESRMAIIDSLVASGQLRRVRCRGGRDGVVRYARVGSVTSRSEQQQRRTA